MGADRTNRRRVGLVVLVLGLLAVGVVALRVERPEPVHERPAPASLAVTISDSAGPGPRGSERGVPTGWSRDRAGAAAAAASAVRMTGVVARSGPLARRDLVAVLASSAYAPRLADEANRNLAELVPPATEGLTWTEFPLTAHAEAVRPDRWRIRLWSMVVVGHGRSAVTRQSFRTTTLELVWEREDWRIDGWDTVPGPTPVSPPDVSVSTADAVAAVAAWPAIGGGA